MSKKQILLITGSGRSGSTLLSKLLNEAEDSFNVNELVFTYLNGVQRDYPCNTGVRFSESEIWQAIIQHYKTKNNIDLLEYKPHLIPNTTRLVRSILLGGKVQVPDPAYYEAYKKAIRDLYESMFETTGASLIIDSSKIAPFVNVVVQMSDQYDIYVLHLVRDPRAVAYSWQKTIKRQDVDSNTNLYMEKRTPYRSSVRWQMVNMFADSLKRNTAIKYHYLKYEQFAQAPQKHLAEILTFLDRSPDEIIVQDNTIQLKALDHGIWGNPNVRTQKEFVKVRYDDTYKQKLDFNTRFKATFFALPRLFRYGYRL